jgi:hypothetical protein
LTTHAYVYVGLKAVRNLDLGLNAGTWGWKHADWDGESAEGFSAMRLKAPPNLVFVVAARLSPPVRGWPRLNDMELWRRSVIDRLVIARVSRPLDRTTEPLWPDGDYPERVGISVTDEYRLVSGASLAEQVLRSTHRSAIRAGTPILGPSPFRSTR